MVAPQHLPHPVSTEPADRYPRHLRAVPNPPRMLIPNLVWGAAVTVVIGLFLLAVFHAVIVDGQTALDNLNHQIEDLQVQNEKLQLYVGQSEAPDRILAEARFRLGMVEPENLIYLSPVEPTGIRTPTGVSASAEIASTGIGAR